jgi:P27 family predicted phage terminase small subunit
MGLKPGPAPVPTAIHKLRGNPSQKNLDTGEPVPCAGNKRTVIEPPPELKGEGFREWVSVAEELYDLGLLTMIDRTALTAYCSAVDDYFAAQAEVEKHGVLIEGRQAGLVKNPALGAKKDALDTMLKFGSRFGLSPSDRVRLGSPVKAEPDTGGGAGLSLLA